jgi:hypothetical protein
MVVFEYTRKELKSVAVTVINWIRVGGSFEVKNGAP